MDTSAKIRTIILDAGPIIRNEPPVSTLHANAEELVTIPAIIDEIKDRATRTRLDTTLRPFLYLRSPKPASIKFIQDFSRKTGDLPVLSRNDIHLLALAYEIECERNGGDWRLRNTPGQERLNGAPPKPACDDKILSPDSTNGDLDGHKEDETPTPEALGTDEYYKSEQETIGSIVDIGVEATEDAKGDELDTSDAAEEITEMLSKSDIAPDPQMKVMDDNEENLVSDDSDSEGWITPSNLKRRQAEDESASLSQKKRPGGMQVATITTDFAMQNVLLQINLNLISSSLARVQHLKTYVLRCHACFQIVKDLSKQFCPRCGKPTLTRVGCSTNQNGEFKIHLKKNMQWNTRGDRYSTPKPISGSANGKIKSSGGGKGGWGANLILAEDQKEYIKAINQQKRHKERDLMDEDYLPSILSGERKGQVGKLKIGAGRNVNSRKRL